MIFAEIKSAQLIAFLLTIVAAQTIAGVLFYVARRKEVRATSKKVSDVAPKGSIGSEPVLPTILKELEGMSASSAQREKVAASLSSWVRNEVSAKVKRETDKLKKEYTQEIEQKNQEVQTVKEKYGQATSRRLQTESVLRSLAEGLVVVNKKGEVVFANPSAERMLGVDKEDAVGKPLAGSLKDEQFLSMMKRSPHESAEQEITIAAGQEQTKKVLRASNAVVEDESGKTVGMVSVLTDVTKQRELDQLKSDFVGNVTHELRTPIVAVKHSLDVILKTAQGMPEDQKNFLTIANRNLDRLGTLVNDLLDLKKIEASKMEMQFEKKPFKLVIDEVCDSMQAWANSKSIHIKQNIVGELPEATYDQKRMVQVLHNLVGNAIKFTPKDGTITIEAKTRIDGVKIEVAVTDTGVGIAKEDLPKVFNKFQQVGEREATDVHGTGLGLALVKDIVELHGGVVEVSSEQGQGARFSFTLPTENHSVKTPEAGGTQDAA